MFFSQIIVVVCGWWIRNEGEGKGWDEMSRGRTLRDCFWIKIRKDEGKEIRFI